MKRILIIVITIVICFACSKDDGNYCWTCQITGPGYNRSLDTCTKEENPAFDFKDPSGNDLSHYCQPK